MRVTTPQSDYLAFRTWAPCHAEILRPLQSILWYTKGDEYIFDLDAVRVAQKYPGKKHYKGAKRGEYSGNPLGKNPGDVWVFPNVKSNHVEKTRHPCQFPLELASRLIRALTSPGDLWVWDPFLGSGTTVAAAILYNRRGVGSEIRREYALLARSRARSAWRGTLPSRPERRVHEPPKDTSLTTPPPNFRVSLPARALAAGSYSGSRTSAPRMTLQVAQLHATLLDVSSHRADRVILLQLKAFLAAFLPFCNGSVMHFYGLNENR